MYCHHLTVHYGKTEQVFDSFKEYTITVDEAIVDRESKSVVFCAKVDGLKVSSGMPHITGVLPIGVKPAHSLEIYKKSRSKNYATEKVKVTLTGTLVYFC